MGRLEDVMAPEGVISMEPVKVKLRNLKDYLKKEEELLYKFASYLADKLNPELVPMGFNLAYELALEDLRRGGDYRDFGRAEVPRDLVGYPPAIYSLLRMNFPRIAEAVCPPDFAKKVIDAYEEVNKKMREERENPQSP